MRLRVVRLSFYHFRLGGFRHSPTTENLYNLDIPNNNKSI